jgi:hypothetical protein
MIHTTHRTLQSINLFVEAQLRRGALRRVVFSKGDLGKIQEYRERLNAAMALFEVRRNFVKLNVASSKRIDDT